LTYNPTTQFYAYNVIQCTGSLSRNVCHGKWGEGSWVQISALKLQHFLSVRVSQNYFLLIYFFVFNIKSFTIRSIVINYWSTNTSYHRSNDDIRKLSADNVCFMSGAFIMQHCYLFALKSFLNRINEKYRKHTMDIHIWTRKFIDLGIVLVKLVISLSWNDLTIFFIIMIILMLSNNF
jgi:hypothetical protein